MNRVNYLLDIPIHSLSLEDKFAVKRLGPYQLLLASGKKKQHFKCLEV